MLYRTFDGGKNFDSLDINTPLSPIWKMDFQDAQNGFMVGSDYSANPHYIYKTKDGGAFVYKTTDGGNSFMKLAIPGVMEIKFYNAQIGYASGFYGNIYKTLANEK